MTIPEHVVFDAEPLVAHADDEPGSETVESFLDAVAADETAGFASCVTLAEVRHFLARKYDRGVADEYVEWLQTLGIGRVGVDELWIEASEFVLEYNPALGDAFALATAEQVDATLLVGGDDDYDDVTDVRIERFREGAA